MTACAQASASSTGTGSSLPHCRNHQLPSLQRLNRTVDHVIEKAVVVIWRKQHHQFREKAAIHSRALAITPLTSSSTLVPGRHTPPAASGKDSEDKLHIRLPFRQKRRHQGGSASSRRQFIQGLAQGLRNGGGGNKRSGRITTSEALCCANQLRRHLAYPPRVVRRRGYPVRYEFHFRHHLNEACAQRAPLLDLLSLIPHSGLHPQPITAKFAPTRYRVASRRRFPA